MKNPDVLAYINKHPKWHATLTSLRELILSTELQETIKWGAPVYCQNNKNIVGLIACQSYAGLWFYNGSELEDTAKVLINAQPGKTQAMRQWRFAENENLDLTLILSYLNQAIKKQGPKAPSKKAKTLEIPLILKEKLQQEPHTKENFAQLSPSKQREFAEYISSAKRQATQIKRLDKSLNLINQGQGLNDQYR